MEPHAKSCFVILSFTKTKNEEKMKTEFIKENAKLIVRLVGSLNTVNAPDLEMKLQEQWEGVRELIFDLQDMDFISSSGLRVILTAQKHMTSCGTMLLKNVHADIKEIFEMTGFDELLTFE